MTINEPPAQRHQKELDDGMATLRKYADSSVNDFDFVTEKNGVKLYARKPDNANEPMIYRGDYLYNVDSSVRPVDMSSAAIFSSSRRIWDNRFDGSEIRVIRSRYSSLSYGRSKAVWPISPRDFSTITLRDCSDERVYLGLFSVVDDEINPPVDGFVRGNLVCTGWKISRVSPTQLILTFINQMDLRGSVPPPLTRSTLQAIPLLTAKLAQYQDKYGFPPTTTVLGCQYAGEDFDHPSATYTLHLEGNQDDNQAAKAAEILCCQKMFPKGFEVVIQGQAKYNIDETKQQQQLVNITDVVGKVTVQVIGKKKRNK